MTDFASPSFLARWQRLARRIRVPLGFAAALVYLWELAGHRPGWQPIGWSLLLVLPGLWVRGYASGYVRKNSELTVDGPYAYVRNPLYLGSISIAAGFAVALRSWSFVLVLAAFFVLIYVPVIASEERFLRETFPEFDWYCARVPRLIPRITPARAPYGKMAAPKPAGESASDASILPQGFSFALYRQHREYNSALGAALLYASLLLAVLLHSRLGH